MQVQYKVFIDGQQKPYYQGEAKAHAVMEKHVENVDSIRSSIFMQLGRGERVNHRNRREGLRVVMTNLSRPVVKVQREASYQRLTLKLDGVVTPPQMVVKVADLLLDNEGYRRRTVNIEANGCLYKAKLSDHKTVHWMDMIKRIDIKKVKVL